MSTLWDDVTELRHARTSPLAPAPEPTTPAIPACEFTIAGEPIPQGSKTVGFNRKTGQKFVREDNPRTKPWRTRVSDLAAEAWAGRPLLTGPVRLDVEFQFPRLKGHYGARGLLPSAPTWKTSKPDGDKLLRAIADALTSVVIRDDSLIVEWHATKVYADPPVTRVRVEVLDR